MQTAREQEAATIRAQGQKRGADHPRRSRCGSRAHLCRGFGKDPEFYDFYRAMQSYDATFGSTESDSSIILSPDNEYLKQFRGQR